MREVIASINGLRSDMDSKFAAIDGKFTAMEANMNGKFAAVDSKINGLDNKLKLIYWVVGAVVVPVIIYVGSLLFK